MDSNNTMEYRIGLEKQNKRNDQVTDLILDNCRASQISGLTDEFVNLETLSLINVGLVTLKGFPKLPKLKRLELSDNRLAGGLNLLHGSPKLQHLNISGNRIRDLEVLEPLKEFHELVTLDLYNCDVTKIDEYRKKVFELLPNLRSLDGYDKNEMEVADSDESEDGASSDEAEARIPREDGDSDDDEDDVESYDEEYPQYTEEDDDEMDGDDDDEEEDEEDDGDEDLDEEDFTAGEQDETVASSDGHASSNQAPAPAKEDGIENGDQGGDDDDEVIDDEEADDEEADGDGSDLKQLEKDYGEGDDDDDDDFEPGQEPDERDHEIDPEDDADEDPDETAEHLSTSNVKASEVDIAEDSSKRGTKRKFEDEGGDEEAES